MMSVSFPAEDGGCFSTHNGFYGGSLPITNNSRRGKWRFVYPLDTTTIPTGTENSKFREMSFSFQ